MAVVCPLCETKKPEPKQDVLRDAMAKALELALKNWNAA